MSVLRPAPEERAFNDEISLLDPPPPYEENNRSTPNSYDGTAVYQFDGIAPPPYESLSRISTPDEASQGWLLAGYHRSVPREDSPSIAQETSTRRSPNSGIGRFEGSFSAYLTSELNEEDSQRLRLFGSNRLYSQRGLQNTNHGSNYRHLRDSGPLNHQSPFSTNRRSGLNENSQRRALFGSSHLSEDSQRQLLFGSRRLNSQPQSMGEITSTWRTPGRLVEHYEGPLPKWLYPRPLERQPKQSDRLSKYFFDDDSDGEDAGWQEPTATESQLFLRHEATTRDAERDALLKEWTRDTQGRAIGGGSLDTQTLMELRRTALYVLPDQTLAST